MKKPFLLVVVRGGCVTEVRATQDMDLGVIIMDYDDLEAEGQGDEPINLTEWPCELY